MTKTSPGKNPVDTGHVDTGRVRRTGTPSAARQLAETIRESLPAGQPYQVRGRLRALRTGRLGKWVKRDSHPVTEARTHFPALVRAAEHAGEITEITRHGHGTVAYVVPPEVVEAAERWEDHQLGLLAEEARRESEGEPDVSLDELFADDAGESDA